MIRKLVIIWAALAFLGIVPAHADVGGQLPAPGNCDYPGVGFSGMEFGVYHYFCMFPTEINGSNHVCVNVGAAAQGTIGASVLIFSASVSAQLGVIEGACAFVCMDDPPIIKLAPIPNPPAAWKNFIRPTKCKPISDDPVDLSNPESLGGVAPKGDHSNDPGADPHLLPNAQGPAVTNPDNPNPDATENAN